MSNILEIENLSKQYRLGTIGTGTLGHDINRWWYRMRGKDDPYIKIGEANDRSSKGSSDYVWALQNISFDVKHGDVLGIVGRNGAGKSTLLKILSKVTGPTTGSIKSYGRIASLLEVGTGFHPELTGRENIYLNGAILGMRKHEIARKFDEIVDFAGVERYIDTPVKRYSSGMYVRLAFAVAAHLEPEVLVVDEVLAVGDAEFQKKAIGKMKDVSQGEGRTVLFVSHNMVSVQSLCTRALLMENGRVKQDGNVEDIIDGYINTNRAELKTVLSFDESNKTVLQNEFVRVESLKISPEQIDVTDEIRFELNLDKYTDDTELWMSFDIIDQIDQIIFGSAHMVKTSNGNKVSATCIIPKNLMNDGVYSINLYINSSGRRRLMTLKKVLNFEVNDLHRQSLYLGKVNGAVRPQLEWIQN